MFSWDGAPPDEGASKAKSSKGKSKSKSKGKGVGQAAQGTLEGDPSKEVVFKLRDINLSLPRGQLCAVVGPVGSGKSSLLQGLIGGELSLVAGSFTLLILY